MHRTSASAALMTVIALMAISDDVAAVEEPSPALVHASIIGIRDICRYMVSQDTIVVRADFRSVMGNRVEEFLGLEKKVDYILEYAFVTRCGVDLGRWSENLQFAGDTLVLRLPEPVLLGRSVCPERTVIASWSSGSFLTTPFALNDMVMSDLLERMWAETDEEMDRILFDCRTELTSTLEEQVPLLIGVERLVIRWGEER